MSIRILVVVEPATLAHVARSYVLSMELASCGAEIIFATGQYFEIVYKEATFPIERIATRSPDEFQRILANRGVIFDEKILETYVVQELDLIRHYSPDIIIGDMRPSLGVSCPLNQLPLVTLTNAYWSPYRAEKIMPFPYFPPLRMLRHAPAMACRAESTISRLFNGMRERILKNQAVGLDRLRARYGLAPFVDYLTGFTFGDLVLYVDYQPLVPCLNLPEHHQYIGPIYWSPDVEMPSWFSEIEDEKKVVYFSLGSSGADAVIRELALAIQEVDALFVVATAGKVSKDNFPKNCFVSEYLPADKVLSRCDLAITNGGSPGVYQALSAGVPVLGVAYNMDQLLCMQALERAGAAMLLRADRVSPRVFRDCVQRMLTDQGLRIYAQRIREELCRESLRKELFSHIERLTLSSYRLKRGSG